MNTTVKNRLKLLSGIAIVVGVLFLLNLLLANPDAKHDYSSLPTGSTYSDGYDGAELLYALFDDIGFRVERHRRPLLAEYVPQDVDVIWHAAGYEEFEDAELDWTELWVAAGGTLVLIFDAPLDSLAMLDTPEYSSEDYLNEHWAGLMGIRNDLIDVTSLNDSSVLTSVPHRLPVGVNSPFFAGEVGEVNTYKKRDLVGQKVYRFSFIDSKKMETRPIIRDGYGALLATMQYGNGRVWAVADPYFFSNLLLQEADNAIVASSILAESRGGDFSKVLFDEYHLGFVQSRSVVDAARTPLGKAILYLGLIAVLALGSAGARFGPVRKSQGAIGVSQRAFVSALAGLWQGANATSAVADALYRRYQGGKNVRHLNLDSKLDELRKKKPRLDELMDVAKKLD